MARLPRHVPTVRVLSGDDILANAPEATRRDSKPWLWQTRVPNGDGSLSATAAVPDDVFGIDLTDVRKRFYYFAEADRGTEPVRRSNRKQSSVARKFEAYFTGLHASLHHTRYGIGNLRILVVTTSRQRIQTMLDALSDIAGEKDCSMFLFADNDQIRAAQHVLAVPWIDGRGAPASLVD